MTATPPASVASVRAKPALFTTNWTSSHSVTLDHPLSPTFNLLAKGDQLEKAVRLSSLCSAFGLLEKDEVELPSGKTLQDIAARDLPSAVGSPAGNDGLVRLLPRQHFWFVETVPILGLFKKDVVIAGTLTWDAIANVALYETATDADVLVRKTRTFMELEGGLKTRVDENIEGSASPMLRWIVEREARKAHIAHMNRYHTLF